MLFVGGEVMFKKLFFFALALGGTQLLTGCVTTAPLVLESDFQRKVMTLCDNDLYCFRTGYSVTWERVCGSTGSDGTPSCIAGYPVSYRSKEYSVETGAERYAVRLPDAGEVRVLPESE